jgi:chaperone BCS1
MEFLHSILKDNPYFSAGFGLLGVGAVAAAARRAIGRLAFLMQRRYLTTIEVTSRDPSYQWTQAWLAQQALTSGSHFTISTSLLSQRRNHLTNVKNGDMDTLKSGSTATAMIPAPGVHYLRWRGTWIKIVREREKSSLLDLNTGLPFETITLTILGRRTPFFQSLLEEAHALVVAQEQHSLQIYTAWSAEWRPFGSGRRRRSLDSIVFARNVKENLLYDVNEFLSSAQWYGERGIPYRRGYLLYGPPGGGKSSFIQALASHLGYSICLLNLSEQYVSDDRLQHLLNVLPPRSILLLEDIDSAMVPERGEGGSTIVMGEGKGNSSGSMADQSSRRRLTFSGLLNAIDGVASAEERIIFMTTNYRDRLDSALIRPGRVDYQQRIGWATRQQLREMFAKFYPSHQHLIKEFVHRISKSSLATKEDQAGNDRKDVDDEDDAEIEGISPAAVQGHFIRFKNDPVSAAREPIFPSRAA